ncbi:MAG: hypothetical protein JWN17_3231 [Frankiales bacterium]|nr:hypothetical protein [Frankiales bacterium]
MTLELPPTDRVVDVVIDTDVMNEVDDQFAIVWALLRPDRLNVVGLLACPWEATTEHYRKVDAAIDHQRIQDRLVRDIAVEDAIEMSVQELHRINAVVGTDVPVLKGAASFMTAPDVPVRSEGVDALIELAHADREGPLYVLGIGAATNLASAVLLDPTIAERVQVVWTSAHPSWWPRPEASYNLSGDLHASRVLFDSGVPLVYLPGYYVGEELRVGYLELEANVRGVGPVGDYLWDTFGSHWTTASTSPAFSKVIWDLINTAYVVEPGWLSSDLVDSPVLGEDLRWHHPAGRHQIREAYDLDRDAVFGDLYRVLAEHAAQVGAAQPGT